jgi:hypothetical protein
MKQRKELMAYIIINVLVVIYALCQAQNLVIQNGQFNDAYDRDVTTSMTIGNPCGQDNFFTLYYNGDLELKGDLHIANSILTVYGDVDENGYDVYFDCDLADLVIDESLSVKAEDIYDYQVYPNPTRGVFYVKTNYLYSVKVYDINGRYLTNTPNLKDFPSGLYIVNIEINNYSFTKKIIRS